MTLISIVRNIVLNHCLLLNICSFLSVTDGSIGCPINDADEDYQSAASGARIPQTFLYQQSKGHSPLMLGGKNHFDAYSSSLSVQNSNNSYLSGSPPFLKIAFCLDLWVLVVFVFTFYKKVRFICFDVTWLRRWQRPSPPCYPFTGFLCLPLFCIYLPPAFNTVICYLHFSLSLFPFVFSVLPSHM